MTILLFPVDVARMCHTVNDGKLSMSELFERNPACQKLFHRMLNPNSSTETNLIPVNVIFGWDHDTIEPLCYTGEDSHSFCLNQVQFLLYYSFLILCYFLNWTFVLFIFQHVFSTPFFFIL